MKGQLNSEEKNRRLHILEETAKETKKKFISKQISNSPIKKVLFETFDGISAHGHTDNFMEVSVESKKDLRGLILPVQIENTDGDICFGRLVN